MYLFMHDMNDMLHQKKKKKLNHTSLFMNASSSLLNKIQICCCDKNWIGFRKIRSVFWELKKSGFFIKEKIRYVFRK